MIQIRPMLAEDSDAVSELVAQLGYPSSVLEINKRLQAIQSVSNHVVLVAETENGKVRGYIQLSLYPTLNSEPTTYVGGLVVDAEFRGKGIGKLLMKEAENWSLSHGYQRLKLTSQMHRTEAHEFYKKLGYKVMKSSYSFAKLLDTQSL